jgi:hypothetical protein
MTDVDRAMIQREKDALKRAFNERTIKQAFTYNSVSLDTDLLFDDLYRDPPANPAGLSVAVVAIEFVVDCYYERGALEPLVKSYSAHKYQLASVFDRLLEHLQRAERVDQIERLWTSVARVSRAEFFYQRPGRNHGGQALVAKAKQHALDAYAQGIDWMTRLGRLEAVERLTEQRDALREERFAALPTPSDLRRLDEATFWQVIATTRSRAETTLEQLAVLGESLRTLKAAEIKRFASLYVKHMKKLYHWNVWALAYAARGGCSDLAFEAFRTWLILQGDAALVECAITDPTRAAERVPREPDLPEGHCLLMIEEAYLQRQGSALGQLRIEFDKPRGKEWTEVGFATTYPQLVRRYGSLVDDPSR